MKSTIKALTPVYKAYTSTIISVIGQMSGIFSEGQYNFVFTIEYASEEELPGIMMQIKPLLRLYGSIILSFDTQTV